MKWFLFWVGLAVVIGVAAKSRGRSAVGWFVLAIVISPLIGGVLVLVLAPIEPMVASGRGPRIFRVHATAYRKASSPRHDSFKPDGVLAGVPYRVGDDGGVDAKAREGLIRFRNMEQFVASVKARDTIGPSR
jgi:hypothetical protein